MSHEINFTINGSLVDPADIFVETESSTYSSVIPHIYAIAAFSQFVVDALALASDIYLIVVISKFQALKTRINNFILQYAIYNILYLIFTNVLILVLELSSMPIRTYFALTTLDGLIVNLCFLILTLMASDWFVSNYHPNIYERFEKYFKYGSYIAVLFATIIWIPFSILCYVDCDSSNSTRFIVEDTCFIFCVIVIISITILKKRKTSHLEASKTEYALTIPKIVFILASFIRFVDILFVLFKTDPEPVYFYVISHVLFRIGIILFNLSPVVVVFELIKINKHFRSAYIKSCKKKRVHNYEDDDLDTDSVTESPASNVNLNLEAAG